MRKLMIQDLTMLTLIPTSSIMEILTTPKWFGPSLEDLDVVQFTIMMVAAFHTHSLSSATTSRLVTFMVRRCTPLAQHVVHVQLSIPTAVMGFVPLNEIYNFFSKK